MRVKRKVKTLAWNSRFKKLRSWHLVPSLWQIEGDKVETVTNFVFLSFKIVVDGVCSHQIKTLAPWKESYDKPRQCIKRQRHHFVNKGLYSRSYGFSSSCVLMWELDLKEGWAPKNWCFWTVVLEKTLESPLDCKIKPVNLKGNQCWLFTERTNAETEVPILRASFLEKTLMLGRIEGKRRRGDRGWDG